LIVNQRPNESLKEYIMRFNQEKMYVKNSTNERVFAALYSGIWANRPLMVELARKQLTTLQEFMDKAEVFINQ